MAVEHVIFASRSIGLRGGIRTVIDELAEEFTRRGLTVSYLSVLPPADQLRVHGPIFELNRFRSWTSDHPLASEFPGPFGLKLAAKRLLRHPWSSLRSSRARRYLKRQNSKTCIIGANPDVFEALRGAAGDLSRYPALRVLHIHGDPRGLQVLGYHDLEECTGDVDAVVALSPSYADTWEASSKAPILSISNPSTVPRAEIASNPTHPRRLLSFSRLAHEKRLDLVIDAFDIVAGTFSDCTLEIWGDGPEEPELRLHAQQKAHADRIRFMGWSNDPVAVFDGATAHLMASGFEGLPMSAIEAMRRGVPTVGFSVSGGLQEILERCGVAASEETSGSLASALDRILIDASFRDHLSSACLEFAPSFDAAAISDQWLALFTRLAENRAIPPTRLRWRTLDASEAHEHDDRGAA